MLGMADLENTDRDALPPFRYPIDSDVDPP